MDSRKSAERAAASGACRTCRTSRTRRSASTRRCGSAWKRIARTRSARRATRRWTRLGSDSRTSTRSARGARKRADSRSTRLASCRTGRRSTGPVELVGVLRSQQRRVRAGFVRANVDHTRWAEASRRPIGRPSGRSPRVIAAADYRFSSVVLRDRQQPALPDAEGTQGTNMIITKKTLSRRTVLRGMGACLALPVLDAMTPALTAAVAAEKARAHDVHLRPERHGDEGLDAGSGRRRLRDDAHPQRVRALPEGHARADGPDGPQRQCARRRRRRSRARRRQASSPAFIRRRRRARTFEAGISVDQVAAERHRLGHAAALARAGLRGLAHGRQLRLGLQLRLHQQPLVARAVDAESRRRRILARCSSGCSAPTTSRCRPRCARSGWPIARASWIRCRIRCARCSAPSAAPTGTSWTST